MSRYHLDCVACNLTLKGLGRHLLGTLKGLVSTDEASRVDKHAARNAADAIKLSIPEASPSLRERLSARKGVLALGHALDAPLGTRLRLLGVQNVDDGGGTILESVQVPRSGIVVEIAVELLTNAAAGLVELGILSSLSLSRVGGSWVVPLGVQTSDNGTETEGTLAETLLNASSGNGSGVVDRDTVVVGIKGLNKVLVQLLVDQIDIGGILRQSEALSNDGTAKVQEDQTCTRKLCWAAREGGVEASLVVVEAALLSIILSTDIDDGVAGS
ncbi:hypothetical protein HG531_008064 [Fusarium graminearum]|nr:hypothetical protein HG531_008064 [Fusarium graminearum]